MTESYGATSTTDDVLAGQDLSGRRVLVTGMSSGLGIETARALAAHGAYVVGTARDLAKAEAATAIVREAAANGGGFELAELELGSLASVRAFADQLLSHGQPFDAVIANAGVMATPFGHTADGFETQFGTNHLGHFVLINRIASLLEPGARVVILSSGGHHFADVDLTDPNFERGDYTPFGAYGRSKTANALFAVAFDARHRARGVRAAAVHPGSIPTELGRYMDPKVIQQMTDQRNAAARAGGAGFKTVAQGAATSVWAAVAPAETVGGKYCMDCQVADLVDDSSALRGGVRPYAIDPAHAEALWTLSERMVGETF
jgi:NAD(P)-dependent dehydrogenase (short-subunit alcohol dehydrogenase family)